MPSHDKFEPGWSFLDLRREPFAPEEAEAWVLPIPYESTTCYGAGTREGPAAIMAASRQLELFDSEFDCEPVMRYGVHTMNPLRPVHTSPDRMAKAIEDAVAEILGSRPAPRLLVVLGGEHSISAGVVRGLARTIGKNDLVAVHIDAHGDLRDEYKGSTYSHACAARRIVDVCPVFQIGVRSLSAEEESFRRGNKRVVTIFSEEATSPNGAFLKRLAAFVRGKQVFFTIDLDGLDPSIMPAVGTPEPGGLSWERTLEIARVVCRCCAGLPVLDVVELAPIPALRAPDFLAAKLIYKLMSLCLFKPSAKSAAKAGRDKSRKQKSA